MDEDVKRREVVELDVVKQHKSLATTKKAEKRSRIADEEQESRNHGENQEPSKRGGKRAHFKKHVAVYGNYDHYYGYRIVKDSDSDPRLKYLKEEWFEEKDCLDVGCNAGKLTVAIAKNFACKSMVGVDIDKGLVFRAYRHLEDVAKDMDANRKSNIHVNGMNAKGVEVTSHETAKDVALKASDTKCGEELLRRVSFREENFISNMDAKPTYDTVLCFSVTKWVHLNWGDDGLVRLFAKIRNLLRPGGILVLEPQPWNSYKNNHLVSEVVRQNFHEIVLRPDNFKEVLLDRVGFRSMQNITKETDDSAKGFNRPIYLVRC